VRTDLYGQVCALLPQVPRAPEQPYPGGASEAELTDLARRLGTALPDDLAAWLRVCKGEAIGPGGVLGARPDHEAADMAARLALYPQWRSKGWLPVAGDGSGNCYVLLTTDPLAGFVAFVDTMADPDRLDHVVATNLWQFLLFLFKRELGGSGWPFDPQAVLAEDPDLARAPTGLLPWSSVEDGEFDL
jgi:cell wall assembly regulator SMI1